MVFEALRRNKAGMVKMTMKKSVVIRFDELGRFCLVLFDTIVVDCEECFGVWVWVWVWGFILLDFGIEKRVFEESSGRC